jgi:hypothetical protein
LHTYFVRELQSRTMGFEVVTVVKLGLWASGCIAM